MSYEEASAHDEPAAAGATAQPPPLSEAEALAVLEAEDEGGSDEQLAQLAWRRPASCFLCGAVLWTWAWLAFARVQGKPSQLVREVASLGPTLVGGWMVLALEGNTGWHRLFSTKRSYLSNGALLLCVPAMLLPLSVHGCLWASWVAAGGASAEYMRTLAGGSGAAGESSATGGLFLGAARGACNLMALVSAPLLSGGARGVLLSPACPAALSSRGGGLALSMLLPALLSEAGWRGVLLPHLLRSGRSPLAAAALSGCLATLWALGPAMVGGVQRGGMYGPLLAMLDAALQVG